MARGRLAAGAIALALVAACAPPGGPSPVTGTADVGYELRGFVISTPPGAPVCDLAIRFDFHLVDDSDVVIVSSAHTIGACALPEFLIDAFVLCQTPNSPALDGDCGEADVPAGLVPGSTLLSFTRSPDFGHLLYGALVVYGGRSSSTSRASHQIRVTLAGRALFQVGSPN